ncbi:MAG: DUF721 domain-containing protein [Candidatus Izemoplasmatales bacterium]|nr:DUF721 domain-containing protein [Candidatus Izemoplasmatales bacterium]
MLSREQNRRRWITRQALRDWYGSEFTKREMAAYPGDGARLSDYLDSVISQTASAEVLAIMELKEKWAETAGDQIAKISRPVSIKDHLLCVEVDHNLWLRELMGPTKGLLIRNINAACGEDFCKDIRFLPSGGTPMPNSSRKKGRKKD